MTVYNQRAHHRHMREVTTSNRTEEISLKGETFIINLYRNFTELGASDYI